MTECLEKQKVRSMEEEDKKLRGKLKIFFGYAAGIGKTYAMLSCARLEAGAGTDIVVGYVEPHTRPETMALLRGLERLPAEKSMENGSIIREFNIEKALKRKPETILIDEMAHTNASFCRNRKRYQDIEELLNEGINVYTTVNVQHIESHHDLVEGFTGISVKERVPDEVFDRASQIEMIDIPPEELIKRLEHGKVYEPEKTDRALSNFFTMENLTALREIALRRMADWVNAKQDMIDEPDKNTEVFEHIMVCLSPSPSNPKVIRQAARMANAFHSRLTAFYVETPEYSDMDREDQIRLQESSRLAEQLGAKIMISYGNDIVEQIAEYARAAGVTKIVLGRTYTKKGLFSIKESFSDRLVKLAPELEIFLIPDTYQKKFTRKNKKIQITPLYFTTDAGMLTAFMVLSTVISLCFQNAGFRSDNLIMVYMTGVLLTALLAKYRITSILFGLVSIFVFNYFFTDPKGTFQVYDPGYVVTFLVMFVNSIIVTTLIQQVRKSAKLAAEKSYRTEILLETSQVLQQAVTADDIAIQTTRQLGKMLGSNVYCFIGSPQFDSDQHGYKADGRNAEQLPKDEIAVAQWVYKNNKHAGATTNTLPGARCLYLAIRNGDQIFAVAGIEVNEKIVNAFEKSVMLAMLNECALAFEKEEIQRKERETALLLEQEKLRGNLLRAISHDLRTPLTSISGNADVLMGSSGEFNSYEKQRIYRDIYEDSIWLINLVENLLSITRIENGTMKIHMQPELVDDVVTECMKHLKRHAGNHTVLSEQEDDMLVAVMDAKLIIQVITNFVDNALKYTPEGSVIKIHVEQVMENIIFEVSDNGNGISSEAKEKVFSMFYTGENFVPDGRRSMGMGLSLCKSIVEAHGGTIWVRDNQPAGAVFGFKLKAEEVKLG